MNMTNGEESDRQLRFIQELLAENVQIAGDVAEIATNTWAIHGVIPVDGDVLVAEFDTYDEANVVLDEIAIQPQFPGLPPERTTTMPL
jgi:hypothetical protein